MFAFHLDYLQVKDTLGTMLERLLDLDSVALEGVVHTFLFDQCFFSIKNKLVFFGLFDMHWMFL